MASDGTARVDVAASVTDPEMPMLTLEDLGVLREVDGATTAGSWSTITPTYSGCPAMATMRDDLVHRLQDDGFGDVEVRVSLSPPGPATGSPSAAGRRWPQHGISAARPGAAPRRAGAALAAADRGARSRCPRCGSGDVELTSEFGPTACKAMYRCTSCLEPFEHVKEI